MRKTLVVAFALCLVTGLFAQSTGGGAPLQTATVTLSSSQIKSLAGAPVLLVPAPGAGSTIIVTNLVSSLNFGTVAYTDAGAVSLSLRYDAGPSTVGTNCSSLYNVITSSASQTGVDVPDPVINPNPSPVANVQNKALVLVNTGANDFAAGDGTLTVTVTYQIVNQ
jgi:hypothetical protein